MRSSCVMKNRKKTATIFVCRRRNYIREQVNNENDVNVNKHPTTHRIEIIYVFYVVYDLIPSKNRFKWP